MLASHGMSSFLQARARTSRSSRAVSTQTLGTRFVRKWSTCLGNIKFIFQKSAISLTRLAAHRCHQCWNEQEEDDSNNENNKNDQLIFLAWNYSDAFQKREKANEDFAIRTREKEKLLELKKKLLEQQAHLKQLENHMYVGPFLA